MCHSINSRSFLSLVGSVTFIHTKLFLMITKSEYRQMLIVESRLVVVARHPPPERGLHLFRLIIVLHKLSVL